MQQERSRILWNQRVSNTYYKVALSCQPHYADSIPGQFVMLRLAGSIDPLLRRPFSIHRLVWRSDHLAGFEILYKVVGNCTRQLAQKKKDEVVDIIGPLGKGFTLPAHLGRVFFVAGGIGVAPMLFLASTLKAHGLKFHHCRCFVGGRSGEDLLCLQELGEFGMRIFTTTDDGSAGDQCLVTDPVEIALSKHRPDMIYACGPMAMLKCLAGLVQAERIPCQASIETMMGCGTGACLGCAVENRKDPEHYYHACMDGPVFDICDLKL